MAIWSGRITDSEVEAAVEIRLLKMIGVLVMFFMGGILRLILSSQIYRPLDGCASSLCPELDFVHLVDGTSRAGDRGLVPHLADNGKPWESCRAML